MRQGALQREEDALANQESAVANGSQAPSPAVRRDASRLPIGPLLALATIPLLSAIVGVAYLPALPTIARSYDASPALLGWSVSVPALVGAACYPVIGRVGDLYGRRRVLLGLVGVFIAGSGCLVAFHSDATLLIGRGAQGAIFAANPLSTALVTDLVGPGRRAQVVPRIVAVAGAGFGLGFLGGALVVENLGLSALSAVLGGLGIAVASAIAVMVRTTGGVRTGGRIDWLGALLLCSPVGMLVLALGQARSWGWASPEIIGLLVGAAALVALFVLRETTTANPLIPRSLLAQREVPTLWALCLLVSAAQLTLYVLLPEQLQAAPVAGGFELSTTGAGAIMTLASTGFVLGGILSRRVLTDLGVLASTACAMSVAACGYVVLAIAEPRLGGTALVAGIALVGVSIAQAAVVYGIVQASPAQAVGTALALLETSFALGSAIGAQVLATVVAGVGTVGGLPTEDAYTAGFALGAGLAVIAALVGIAAGPWRRLRRVAGLRTR